MITSRELEYVSGWTSKVPYPGIDYAEKVASKLISAYEEYKKFYKDKQYDIITSSGEQILFEILVNNLCHMLGIDYKNLRDDFWIDYRKNILGLEGKNSSYELITAIIKNIEEVIKYDYDHKNRALNYYRIMIKCSIFEKLSDFSRFNFGIINFNHKTYEKFSGSRFSGNSEKFLYVQSNEAVAPIFMMGILPNGIKTEETKESFAVESLLAPVNVENFFRKQEVSIPTQILITTSDSMQKLEATPTEKIALLNQYRSIINQYGLPNCLNIYGDYESVLVEQSNAKTRKKVIK